MQVIRDPASLSLVTDTSIRQMIQQRIDAIASDEPYDSSLHGYFLVQEEGDTLEAINAQIGFDILCNRWTGLRHDHADYTPSFEILEEYASCFDLLFILDDSGFGIEVFIPKTEGLPPELTAMCQKYAVPGNI